MLRKINKMWRPGTGILMGLNVFLQPNILLYLFAKNIIEIELVEAWFALYGTECALFAGLAGIRQFDKHKQHDVARDINMGTLGYQSSNFTRTNRKPRDTRNTNRDMFEDNYTEFME